MKASPETVAELRRALRDADDEVLDQFLRAHTLGSVAGALVEQTQLEARVGFFLAMASQFPHEFDSACELVLKKSRVQSPESKAGGDAS